MASRGASLFAFFFCNEKKKGGFGAQPHKKPRLGVWPWAGCKGALNGAITRTSADRLVVSRTGAHATRAVITTGTHRRINSTKVRT